MEITGRIIFDLPEQNGTSKAGNAWRKKEYVLETEDTYPKKVHFDFFGDRVDQFPLKVGQRIKLSFDIESREYNGRWFTSIRGWRAEDADSAPAPAATAGMGAPAAAPAAPVPPVVNATDDLPF
ncbi:MAG: DUF3127 domain-containing protein [Muribaculaceae bacterium]|nr:DUF3127 domain-containing protein [Muribaculaceae bacterium]MDE6485932.1 DUF3127 domain-containing protein [Muribaculaceae bacterium]